MMTKYNDSLKNNPIHVLIISDRLYNQANALAEYLRSTEKFNVIGMAETENHALELAQNHSFDYLIIAGYLQAERTYHVIAELQKQEKEFLPVQWAMIDSLITRLCQRYKIPLRFERTLPMAEFVHFLDEHKNDSLPYNLEEMQETKPTSNQNGVLHRLFRMNNSRKVNK